MGPSINSKRVKTMNQNTTSTDTKPTKEPAAEAPAWTLSACESPTVKEYLDDLSRIPAVSQEDLGHAIGYGLHGFISRSHQRHIRSEEKNEILRICENGILWKDTSEQLWTWDDFLCCEFQAEGNWATITLRNADETTRLFTIYGGEDVAWQICEVIRDWQGHHSVKTAVVRSMIYEA